MHNLLPPFYISLLTWEVESLVINCPLFKEPLKIGKTKIIWDNKTESGELIIY